MEEYVKLCCHIVEDYYGSFLAQIFRQLTQLGRLSVHQIAQKCRLPLRQVKTGLAALIQLHLIYHYTSSDGLSTYQANTTNAYNIMRTGRLIELVRRKFGDHGAEIMEILAVMGFATAHELEAQVLAVVDPTSGLTLMRFRVILGQMVSARYISAIREANFQSPFDSRHDTERFLRDQELLPTATSAKKSKVDADAVIDQELERRIDRTISAAAIDRELDTEPNQDNTLLSPDFSNLVLHVRNERIAGYAEKPFGKEGAQVMRAACSQIDQVNPRPLPQRLTDDPTNSIKLLNMISLVSQIADNRLRESDKMGAQVNGNGTRRLNGNSDERRVAERQLAILAEGTFSFLLQAEDQKSWFIDQSKLNSFLWDKEMFRLIGESLPEPALRIVRILADKGKLDDKAMLDLGLLKPKQLRKCLSSLQTMGFLELQEVPRDPQRQPKSTFFLYFYDIERVRRVLLDRLCKAMSRLYQRLGQEREKASATLSKIERADFQGNEEKLLSPEELRSLYHWRQRERWFLTEIHRLDDTVIILRDI